MPVAVRSLAPSPLKKPSVNPPRAPIVADPAITPILVIAAGAVTANVGKIPVKKAAVLAFGFSSSNFFSSALI